MDNQRIYTGSPWEKTVAYSRARRVGNHIWVAGTTAVRNGQVVAPGDFYLQTKEALTIVTEALGQVGATPKDVVRTRLYVTDIRQWEAVAKAHAEFFKNIDPVSTMVEVRALINPDMVIEVEVDAFLQH